MVFWQFVLAADQDHDLAARGAGAVWFGRQRFDFADQLGTLAWPTKLAAEWSLNVRCLRRIGEAAGVPIARAKASHEKARRVSERYLRRFFPETEFDHENGQFSFWLNWRDLGAADLAGYTSDQRHTVDMVDTFWVRAFGSLIPALVDEFVVCGLCGTTLERTPTGRGSNREFCSDCRHAAWRAEQPEAELRAKWAEQKRRQRAERKRDGRGGGDED